MRKVSTSLTDEQLLSITQSGMSPYAFIQKAVEEKLAGDASDKKMTTLVFAVSERLTKLELKIGEYKKDNGEVLEKITNHLQSLNNSIKGSKL